MAAVAVRGGLGAGHDPGPAEVLRRERVARDLLPVEPQQREGVAGHGHEPGRRQRLRPHAGETRPFHRTRAGLLGRVQRESPEGDVVEVEPLERGAASHQTHVGHAGRSEESEGDKDA